MTHADHAPSADAVKALLADALSRPASEGARIVALHWLHELTSARAEWSRLAKSADNPDADDADDAQRRAADMLHKARVALRRLRATLREHASLDLNAGRRTRRALRQLGRATSAVRDHDVQRAWLTRERHTLSPAALAEADALLMMRSAHATDAVARVSRAFEQSVDVHAKRLARRLATFTVERQVGDTKSEPNFASQLADRVERAAIRLRRDLDEADHVDAELALHHVRLRLKRQRAMLAPFTHAHRAIAAWYQLATHGQDRLGAMRDAQLLAARADANALPALADALRDVAETQFAAFQARWTDHEAVAQLNGNAVQALRTYRAPDDHGLPMEIERKFLLHGLPPAAAMAPSVLIEQGWLPGTLLRERLRRTLAAGGIERFTRTVKLGRPGSRIEVEEPTDQQLFAALWPLTVSARIRKRRHMVPAGELLWEIDVFLDRDLVVAEVELTDETQPVAIPEWLAPFVVKEVTNDPSYLNSVMAQRDVAAPDNAHR